MGVPYWRTKQDTTVNCQDCPWRTYGANGWGNAARHYHSTGHVIRVETMRVYYVGQDAPPSREEAPAG